MSPIPENLMGDLWPNAFPGTQDADYGSATLTPTGAFEVRSHHQFTLTYTVGAFGLNDTGAIKLVQRWTHDGGPWQTGAPTAANYVTATASNGVTLDIHVETYPHQRPWYNGLRLTVRRGYMKPGDTITLVLGDQSQGGPGMRLQTFCEKAFEFKLLADPCATGAFIPVASPHIEIVAGKPERWVMVAPTLRRPGTPFQIGMRVEDAWGNACDVSGEMRLEASGPVTGLPPRVSLVGRGTTIEGLSAAPGTYRFHLRSDDGREVAVSNPLVIQDTPLQAFWGDLHGQSGETVGIDTAAQYFDFARDVAFLDVTSHQANDFHLKTTFWQELNALTAARNEDGRFTIFPGYEWSANTPLGGDHNVFFRHEGEQIVRSSHTLLDDRSDLGTGAHTLEDLFERLQGVDAVLYAHIGGRPADITRAEDARLRTAVEVHSDWGTFEWVAQDAFAQGYRVGIVANSDGHKGAPGACYPGASEFGAYSGLTCFLAPELTRDGIFEALRARHHYATTGARTDLSVTADLGDSGAIYAVDPRVTPGVPDSARQAMMGDIAVAPSRTLDLQIAATPHAPILRVDVMNGADVIATHLPWEGQPLGTRARVVFQGAEYRGRGRQSYWQGEITVQGAEITRMARFNHWNLERPFGQQGASTVEVDVVTTGNLVGCDLWLSATDADIMVKTELCTTQTRLTDLPLAGLRVDAGGLDRNITLMRLPDVLTAEPLTLTVPAPLEPGQDNPLWVRVTYEDGHLAWSSPIYALTKPA